MRYDNIYYVPMAQEGRMRWTRENYKSYCEVEKLDRGHAVEFNHSNGAVQELYIFEEAAHAAMFFGWGYLDCMFEGEGNPERMALHIGGLPVDMKAWHDGKLLEKPKAPLHYWKCLYRFTDCQNHCSEDYDGYCDYTCDEYERLRSDEDWLLIKEYFGIQEESSLDLFSHCALPIHLLQNQGRARAIIPPHGRRPDTEPAFAAPRYTLQAMDRIRLIHNCRTVVLNRMFDEFGRKPGSSAEQVSDEIIVIAQAIQSALSESEGIGSPPRGLFVLALQQVVDSFLAGLLTDEPFEWLAQQQQQADQILLGSIDLGTEQ